MTHLDTHNIICPEQHRFRKGYSCESQLINTIQGLTAAADKGGQTDMIIMDFEKAFDKVPIDVCWPPKLHNYGIRGKLHIWVRSFLNKRQQRVMVNHLTAKSQIGCLSHNGVPQGTVSGLLWFVIYINDHPDNIKSNISLFANDCVLYRTVKSPSDAENLQHVNTFTSWQDRLLMMKFNENKMLCYENHTVQFPTVVYPQTQQF